MPQDIHTLARFAADAEPASVAGRDLLYSEAARRLFVVESGRAVPVDPATVILALQRGVASVLPEAREMLLAILRGDDGAVGLRSRDGYPSAPEDLGMEDVGLMLRLRNLTTSRESDLVLARESPGEDWTSHVIGVGLLAAGRSEEAAVHLRAAWESDPLDLKALNYYLLARDPRHRVEPHRLPPLLHLEHSVATPNSAAVAEVLGRDLSDYPSVSSGWHLVNLALTALTILLLAVAVAVALMSPAAAGY